MSALPAEMPSYPGWEAEKPVDSPYVRHEYEIIRLCLFFIPYCRMYSYLCKELTKIIFMKHLKILLFLAAILTACSTEGTDPVDHVEDLASVELSVKDTVLLTGESFTLEVKYIPETEKTYTGTWTSSDENVVTVNGDGLVTAIAVGDAVIRFTVSEKIYDECTVSVEEKEIPIPDAIVLYPEYLSMEIGESSELKILSPDSDDFTHPDIVWESSDNEVAEVSASGMVTAKGFGTVMVRAVLEDLDAYCLISVEDPAQPKEYDASWLEVPYPYLEYPTTRERIIAAENDSDESGLILRKLVGESDGVLSFEVRDYFDQGPIAAMFNNTFYDLSPEKGDRFAWGYLLGISRQDMVDGVMVEIMEEIGYSWKKNVDRSDGTYAAWYSNESSNRSALIYIMPYTNEPDRVYGVIEWRILEDDSLNDGSQQEGDPLPARFTEYGASMDDVRAYESEHGGVINPDWCYSSDNLAFDVIPEDEFSTFFVNYVFDNVGGLYWIQLFLSDVSSIFTEDGSSLNETLIDNLKANGYSMRSELEYYSPGSRQYIKFIYYDENIINGDSAPIACVEYMAETE